MRTLLDLRGKNEIGYIETNCVTCCKNCNKAKGTLTTEEFLEVCSRVFNFQKAKVIQG